MEAVIAERRRSFKRGNFVAELMGPKVSSYTFGWLAAHRGRLRTLMIGTTRLVFIVARDSSPDTPSENAPADLEAIAQLVYGDGRLRPSDQVQMRVLLKAARDAVALRNDEVGAGTNAMFGSVLRNGPSHTGASLLVALRALGWELRPIPGLLMVDAEEALG